MQLHKGASSGSLPFLSLDKLSSQRHLGKIQDGALILKTCTLSLGSSRETNPEQLPQGLSMVSVVA